MILNISKHNKSNRQQADSHIKLMETQSDSTKIRNKTKLSTLFLTINIVLEALARAIIQQQQRKEQVDSNWKEVKLLLFAGDMIV